MAKSNSFFSIRRGSTKSHTYSGWQGQQVTKDRVVSVKNPRSVAQQNQRQKFAAVGNFYKYLKFILNHSWEGVSYGVNSYNKFMSLNVKNFNTASMIIPEFGSKVAEAGEYQISEGSIGNPVELLINDYGGFAAGVLFGTESQTAKGLKDAFGSADYVTIVGLYGTVEPDGSPNVNYQTKGFAIRLHKPTAADGTSITTDNALTLMDAEFVNIEASKLSVVATASKVEIDLGTDAETEPVVNTGIYVQCIGVIASAADGGSSAVLRSTETLKLTPSMSALVAATNANNAESWPVGADYILNGEATAVLD